MEIPFDIIKSNESSKWAVFIHGFGGSRRMFKKQIDKFREYFNILILDLPGHGESKMGLSSVDSISLTDIAKDVVGLLHKLNIEKASFIGISLGTLIVANIALVEPQIIEKAVLGGAVCGINTILNGLIHFVNMIKNLLPYTLVVSTFAYLMMPRHNHKKSRTFMINESKHLGKTEFMKWFDLVVHNISFIKDNIKDLIKTKSIFIMGSQDYVFLHNVKNIVYKYGFRFGVINKCGHVCNIEKAKEFNEITLNFLLK